MNRFYPETLRSMVGNGSIPAPKLNRALIPLIGRRGIEIDSSRPPVKPLPNPFKGLTSRSAEHVQEDISDGKACTPERLSFGEDVDMGAVALGGPVIGLRTTSYANGVRGIVWSSDELAVSSPVSWWVRYPNETL